LTAPSFLNLPQYRVLAVREDEHDYHVSVEAAKPVMVCRHCGSVNVAKWGGSEIVVRDLPAQGKRVNLYIRAQRFRCEDCERTAFEPLPAIADGRRMTKRLVAWIGAQSLRHVFASIGEETGVDEKTVRNIFHDYVRDLEASTTFATPRWLGIDEIHVLKRPRCVLTNVETRTIIDMLSDRSKATVAQRLFRLRDKADVRFVAMDMWTPYRDAARAVLPKAKIVVDKFHVIRMANYGIEKVRKGLRESLAPKERRGLMHDRFVLLRRERNLDARSRFLLDSWMTLHPTLGAAYRLKESFYAIYEATSKADAEQRYDAWAASITPETAEAFRPLTTAWKNWHPEILAYFDHRVTNAYTESLNSLIRVMNRVGRGYSFEALRAKMLYTEGLHKVERPKFERRDAASFSAFMSVPPGSLGMMLPDDPYDEPANYGTDISTLASRIEADRF
jgi:transposase